MYLSVDVGWLKLCKVHANTYRWQVKTKRELYIPTSHLLLLISATLLQSTLVVKCCIANLDQTTYIILDLLQILGEQGKKGFYEGRIAKAIATCIQQHGGSLTVEDLRQHESTFDTPIKTTYRGIDVWEMPPNGQGITALLALNILEGFDFTST